MHIKADIGKLRVMTGCPKEKYQKHIFICKRFVCWPLNYSDGLNHHLCKSNFTNYFWRAAKEEFF